MKEVSVGARSLGDGRPVFVVAEAGVAHFGRLDQARRLVDIAAEAGADAVKFQIYDAAALIIESDLEWRMRMGAKQLRYEDFKILKQDAEARGILFFATPHEERALEYLVEELKVALLKVGSGEVGNLVFLRKVAARMLPTLVSLGLHTEREIDQVVRVFQEVGNPSLVLLHCVTSYPAAVEECNLRTITWLQRRYDCPVGYSDHAVGHDVALAAVALGACAIEKHFFIDRTVEGSQDAPGACDATDLGAFVAKIRALERALGVEGPNPSLARMRNLEWARKSVVAARPLKRGHRLRSEDLTLKRPGRGIAPEHVDSLLGRRLGRDVDRDELVRWSDLEGGP